MLKRSKGYIISCLLFLPSIASAEINWIETAKDDECSYYKGEETDGELMIRAICEWDFSVKDIYDNIGDFESHSKIFSQLSASELVSKDDNQTNILQIHDYPGLTDRTAIIEYKTQDISNGKLISFEKSENQEGISSSYVEVPKNSGSWEITKTDKGSKIIFISRYSAGGYIPSTLTGWFQAS